MSDQKKIGKFILKGEISRGGMGIVFNGYDEDLKRPLAIKMLPHEIFANKEQKDRFVLEAQIVAKLDHPNIMKVYSIEYAEDTVWIVMELLKGTLLSDLIKDRGQVPVSEAANIIEQLSRALYYAHSKGIIHRDIKPGNVMISDEGVVKLMDFGIARDEDADLNLTQAGTIMGTPKYMSPEQFSGEKTDQRSDVYSLGVMAYEILAGSPPFSGKNLAQIAYKHMHEKAVPLRKKVKNLNPELERFINKSLEKKVEERLSSLKDIDLGVCAGKINLVARKKINRYKTMAVVLFFIMLAGAMFFFLNSRKAEAEKSKMILSLKKDAKALIDKGEWFKAKGLLTEASVINSSDKEIEENLKLVAENITRIQDEKQAEKIFHNALQALKKDDVVLFHKLTARAIAVFPAKKEHFQKKKEEHLKSYQNSKGKEVFAAALEELDEGNITEFNNLVKKASAADPLNKDSYAAKASEKLAKYNREKAKDLYSKALKFLEQDDDTSFNKFLEKAHELDAEARYLNKGKNEQLSYKNIKANKLYEKAILFAGENNIKKADEVLAECTALNPLHADALNMMAENCLYSDEIDYKKYTSYLGKSLEIKPQVESRWRNLILAYSESGDIEKAKDALNRALKHFPDSSPLKNLSGSLG